MTDPLASVSAAAVKATHSRIRESMHPAAGFRGTHTRDYELEADPHALTEAQHPATADLAHSLYNTPIHLAKHSGSVTAKYASGSEHKVLRRLAPTMSKAKHAELSLAHSKAADAHDAAWSKARAKAHHTTFGKEPGIADYKVSGVGRDEYSDSDKDTLRHHARAASDHRIIGHAHARVAGGPAMRTAGATNEDLDGVAAQVDDTEALAEWGNVNKFAVGKHVMVGDEKMKIHKHERKATHSGKPGDKMTVLHVGPESGPTHAVYMHGHTYDHTHNVISHADGHDLQRKKVTAVEDYEPTITAANLQELAGALAGAHAVATEHGASVTHRGLGKGITVRHTDKAKAETIHAALKHHGFTVGAVRTLGDEHHFHVGHPTQKAEAAPVKEGEHALGARVCNKLAPGQPCGKGEVIFHRRDSNTHKVTKYKVKQDDGAITHWDAANTQKESTDEGAKKPYTFSFHPGDGADRPRITWKRHGTDTNSVHDLATAAAKKDYPKAHGFKTDSPQDEAATDMTTDNSIAAGGAQVAPAANLQGKDAAEAKPKLGTGKRFASLVKSIGREKNPPRDPAAVAAAAGRAAHGAKQMSKWSHHEGAYNEADLVDEAEGTFTSKPEHRFQTADGQHEYRGGRNSTAGTFDHRHYVKKGAGWKHVPDHGYDGHDSAEDAAASAKGDRDQHDALNAKKESLAQERAEAIKSGEVLYHPDLEPHLLSTLKAHGGAYHGKQKSDAGEMVHHFTIPRAHAAAHNTAYNTHVNARHNSHKDVTLGHYALTGVGEGLEELPVAERSSAGMQIVKAARQDAGAQLKTHVAAFKLHKAAGRRDDARGALKLAKNAKIRLGTLSHESTGVAESLEEMQDLAVDLAELAGAEFLADLAADTYEAYQAARRAGDQLPEGAPDVCVHTHSEPVHMFGPTREDQHRCVVFAEGHPPLGFFETEEAAYAFACEWSTKHLLSTNIRPLAI